MFDKPALIVDRDCGHPFGSKQLAQVSRFDALGNRGIPSCELHRQTS